MHHIIYLSWVTVPLTTSQLQHLLVHARRRNAQLALTGILLYGNECFVQVLEGEEAVVQEVYGHIRRDARHHNILTFANKSVAQRAFPEWRMAFQPVSSQQFEDVVGHVSSTNIPLNTAGLSDADTQLFDLLRTFVLP